METFKAIVATLLSPLVISLMLQLTGWWVWRRWQRLGTGLVFCGTLILVLGSMSVWTYETRRSAEYQYAPLPVEQLPGSEFMLFDRQVGVHGAFLNPPPSGTTFMRRVRSFFERRIRPRANA